MYFIHYISNINFFGARYNIFNKYQANVGYVVISMLFGLVFAGLYRDSKKRISIIDNPKIM